MRKNSVCCFLLLTFAVSGFSQDNPGAAPAAQVNRPRRIRVSAGVLGGILEHPAKPLYPEEAVRAGINGDVILQVEIDESGRVARGLAVEGDPLLVAASIEALKEFRFHPYLLAGTPLSVESQIGFKFALHGKGDKARGSADYTFEVPYRPEFRTGAVTQEGAVVLSPRKVSGPDPLIPTKLAGKSGSVYLTVTIGADGMVEDVKVISGDELFVGPVVAAVKQAVFEPQLIGGKPSPAILQESYHFGARGD